MRRNRRMPAETTGFAYLELAEIVPLLTAYLGVSGGQVPPETAESLEPLKASSPTAPPRTRR